MNVVLTMAIGSRTWGDFALNLCLSIKASSPTAKVALIHDGRSILGLETHIERHFDYSYNVGDQNPYSSHYERAFYLKTQLYRICEEIDPRAIAFMYTDADVIMLPGRRVEEWFSELKGKKFTAWNNAIYDFETKETTGSGYTFWCNPEDAEKVTHATIENYPEYGHKMPQINSSFLYWEISGTAWGVFKAAREVWSWSELTMPYQKYKGVKPDELCFNIASMLMCLPHQTPYYPIFFQFASENHGELYIQTGWPAMGFAGEDRKAEHLTRYYNHLVAHYREMFDVEEPFAFNNELKVLADTKQIILEPKRKGTLYRRGELEKSDGGIFNPSGLLLGDGTRLTIFRKEANYNIGLGYRHESALPVLHSFKRNKEKVEELKLVGFDKGIRVEDFRLFNWFGTVGCSHTLIENNLKKNMRSFVALSTITGNKLEFQERIDLQIETNAIEKNWVFFTSYDKKVYCIYSLFPYRLFRRDIFWKQVIGRKKPESNWFHKGQFICNSTNPIAVEQFYLMWFHTKESGVYHHGVVLIDIKTLEIAYATPNSILIKDSSIAEGIARGIVYVSGCWFNKKENTIRVFFGEGDSSACYVDFNKDELMNEVMKYPV